jgi:serine protease Do
MLKRLSQFAARPALLAAGWVALNAADIIQLKEKGSLSGKILAEKRDQVVVDMGYTVLLVPRNQIAKIVKSGGLEEPEGTSAKAAGESPAEAGAAREPPVVSAPAAAGEIKSALFATAAGSLVERSVRELAKELGEAVVQVRTPGGLGSGFFLNEDGFLITNFHVIEGETQISVEVYHQRGGQLERKTYKQVRIIAMNKFDDLALLKIEDAGATRFKQVLLGQADALAVGERVFAIGSPLGLERTVTEGIISTKTRQMQGELYLQTTAQINPGNSGGPLFNLRGEVIGVTNMKMTFGEGLGFAIPVEAVRYFLGHRDAFAYDNDNPSNAYRYLEPPRRMQKPVAEGNQ